MLPDGISTERHHIHTIVETASDTGVGYLWYEEREKAGRPCAFLCDIGVFPDYRRRGFALAALEALADLVAHEHSTMRLELHVFGQNGAARALYAKAGFAETNVLMAKTLDG